jgi:hypothetical protein
MKITNLGEVTKCMNPEIDCPNIPDPSSGYVIVYKGKPLVLCNDCGPDFQLKAVLEKAKLGIVFGLDQSTDTESAC